MPISELAGWLTGWIEGNFGLAAPLRHDVGLLRGDPPAAQSWVFLLWVFGSIASVWFGSWPARLGGTEAGSVFLPVSVRVIGLELTN